MNSNLRIVLFQPDIPGNTGTILRLAACLGLAVDIIQPAGFRLDDKSLRRAGMDYLERAAMLLHDDWSAFEAWRSDEKRRLIVLTTKAEQGYTEFEYLPGDCLLFGRESSGVPEFVHEVADQRLTIKMGQTGRSLNIAMSVAMATGEAIRQTG
ncbi:MAG: tRNA methyltransferase [Rhizobiaceae bacterium]|nr:tRNA methyltransferase [Rhizobiaceae bacterium]